MAVVIHIKDAHKIYHLQPVKGFYPLIKAATLTLIWLSNPTLNPNWIMPRGGGSVVIRIPSLTLINLITPKKLHSSTLTLILKLFTLIWNLNP